MIRLKQNLSYKYMPNVLVGSLERTKSYGHAEHALAAPIFTRHKCHLAHIHRLATVNQELDRFFHILAQDHLKRVVVLVEARAVHRHDKIKKRLQASFGPWRIVLDLVDVVGQIKT